MFYFFTIRLSTNNSTSLCRSEHFTSPTKSLFLIIYPSKNTRSGPTTSTETTTPDHWKSSYVTQTELTITITHLIFRLRDKFKEFVKDIKEPLKETIAKKYEKDRKPEEQLQPLSLQIKDNSLKLNEQENQISSFKASSNGLRENMSNDNKISTKLEIARTENEECLKMKSYQIPRTSKNNIPEIILYCMWTQ